MIIIFKKALLYFFPTIQPVDGKRQIRHRTGCRVTSKSRDRLQHGCVLHRHVLVVAQNYMRACQHELGVLINNRVTLFMVKGGTWSFIHHGEARVYSVSCGNKTSLISSGFVYVSKSSSQSYLDQLHPWLMIDFNMILIKLS